jgi:hypothetical protein
MRPITAGLDEQFQFIRLHVGLIGIGWVIISSWYSHMRPAAPRDYS